MLFFLKLFEFEIVRFFYAKVGLFKKSISSNRRRWLLLEKVARRRRAKKAYQFLQEHFVFEGLGKPFFRFRINLGVKK